MGEFLLSDEIIFDSKPEAVPYNYRISYKLSQLCLIIASCCIGRSGCSLVKLHIISNALNTKEYSQLLEDYISEKSTYMIIRFDPSVNRAIKFAVADNLICQIKNGSFRLTEKGKQLINEINRDETLLVNEKQYLSGVSKKLTNEIIEKLMSAWRYKNAEDK
ncbi:MAG: hypothetical protein K0R50_1597 [Eubacterium sp.]|nr:hypothetical protein [Eubacterium sp.]